MRKTKADHRRSATFPQIKPTKINLSLFGRWRCPNEHVGFPDRAAQVLSLLLYSPAQDGKHIKCFPLRAELATN